MMIINIPASIISAVISVALFFLIIKLFPALEAMVPVRILTAIAVGVLIYFLSVYATGSLVKIP